MSGPPTPSLCRVAMPSARSLPSRTCTCQQPCPRATTAAASALALASRLHDCPLCCPRLPPCAFCGPPPAPLTLHQPWWGARSKTLSSATTRASESRGRSQAAAAGLRPACRPPLSRASAAASVGAGVQSSSLEALGVQRGVASLCIDGGHLIQSTHPLMLYNVWQVCRPLLLPKGEHGVCGGWGRGARDHRTHGPSSTCMAVCNAPASMARVAVG
jgi:hypothetical protein